MSAQTNAPKSGEGRMHAPAQYWAVDLHVHTPASDDVKTKTYGDIEPSDLVEAALKAGLDAIAITDHNTSDWCDLVTAAAADSDLVVLPGVEISTTEGHLLAIFDEDTPASEVDEVLVELGIGAKDRGSLDTATNAGFKDAAKVVTEHGGLAIPAHADQKKGLLKISVKAHVKRLLLNPDITALEIVHLDSADEAQRKVGRKRQLTFVQGSDCIVQGKAGHRLAGLGQRRTYIKASRPDLVGIRHALQDADLRVRLDEPSTPKYPWIESIHIAGEFFEDHTVWLCPDLNSFLGGTGTGKSLVVEALRFVVEQQVPAESFAAIRKEVDSRLDKALGDMATIRVLLRAANGHRYSIERSFSSSSPPRASVFEVHEGEQIPLDIDAISLLPIASFSQGEVLEYARQPVGRMKLIDDELDLDEIHLKIEATGKQLRENAETVVQLRQDIAEASEGTKDKAATKAQIKKLKKFFDSAVVSEQDQWQRQGKRIRSVESSLAALELEDLDLPELGEPKEQLNSDLLSKIEVALDGLARSAAEHVNALAEDLASVQDRVADVMEEWSSRHAAFTAKLDKALQAVDQDGRSLSALRKSLERLQRTLAEIEDLEAELEDDLKPDLELALEEREGLLKELDGHRADRRKLRRSRIKVLNQGMAGSVKLDIPSEGDASNLRDALERLSVGSNVRKHNLDALGESARPIPLGRSLLQEDVDAIVEKCQVTRRDVERLLANIEDRDLWSEVLELQLAEKRDVLKIRFKKPETSEYAPIEELAHGQKCTAVLVILLADGDKPVVIDQPEDALHAPWIEEYLVSRLRELRGTRQYIFATRSPGLVVSADAELIVTLGSTADKGEIEASGSLERFDLNALALYHLEGGPLPLSRRVQKLSASMKGGRG